MANIMVVDDAKFSRKMLSDILVEEGHEIIVEAENAGEAVEFYEKLNPDVVTMDIVMPEIGGVDSISALKAMVKADPKAKVVIVSGMGQQDVIEEFINAGAKDFIVKPFQPSNIADVVASVLENA
ncbi:MAG: two-component system response regulator [Planctomycetota bacterium]|nr:MAG: two-component system response regulator [Planctomycetota bacterium]